MLKIIFDIFVHKDQLFAINHNSKIICKKLNYKNSQKIAIKKNFIKINRNQLKYFSLLDISGGNANDNNSKNDNKAKDIVKSQIIELQDLPTTTIFLQKPEGESSTAETVDRFYFTKDRTSKPLSVYPLYSSQKSYMDGSQDSYRINIVDDTLIDKEEEIRKENYNKNSFSGNLWDNFVCRLLFDENGCRRIAMIKLEDIYEREIYYWGDTKMKHDELIGTKLHWNYHDAFYPICYRGSFYPLGTYDYPPLIECKTRYLRWHFHPTEVYIKLRKDRFNDYYPKIRIYRRRPDYYFRSFNDDYIHYHYDFNPNVFYIFKKKELKEINCYRGWRGFFYKIYLFLLDCKAKLKSLIFNFRRKHFERINLYSSTIARRYPRVLKRRTSYSSKLTNRSIFNSLKIHRETRLDLNDIYKLKIGRFYTFGNDRRFEKTNFYKKLKRSRRRRYQLSPENFIVHRLNNNLLDGTRLFHNTYINGGKYISNKLTYITKTGLPNNRVNFSDDIFNSYYGYLRHFNYYQEIIKPNYCIQKSLVNGLNYYKTIERKNFQKTPIYKYDPNEGYFIYKFNNKKVGAPKFAIYTEFPNKLSKRDNNKILYNYPQISGKYYEFIKNYPIRQMDQKGCLMYPCPFIDTNGNIFYEPKYYNWTLFYPNYYPESLSIDALNPQQFWLKQHFWIKQYFQKTNSSDNELIKTKKNFLVDDFLNLNGKFLDDYSLVGDFKHYKRCIKLLENCNNFYYIKPPQRARVVCLKSQMLDAYNLFKRSNQLEKYLNSEYINTIRVYNRYGKVTRNEALMMRIEDLKKNNILYEKALKENKKFVKIFNLNKPLRYYQDYIKNNTKRFWKYYLKILNNNFENYKRFEKNYLNSIIEQKSTINNKIRKINNESNFHLNIGNFPERNLRKTNKSKFSKIQQYFNDLEVLKIKKSSESNKYEKNLTRYKEHYEKYLIKYEKYLTNKDMTNHNKN